MIDGSPHLTWNFSDCLVALWLWTLNCLLDVSPVCALRLPLPGRLSTVPNFTSSLLMLFFKQTFVQKFCYKLPSIAIWRFIQIFDENFCLLYWTASKLPRLLNTASKFALFSVSGLKDEKLIKNANLHENWHMQTILESVEYFCHISSNRSLYFRAVPFQSWVVF